jgi:WD40 repeat protein
VALWDARTAAVARTFAASNSDVLTLSANPSDTVLAGGFGGGGRGGGRLTVQDGGCSFWDLRSARMISTMRHHRGQCRSGRRLLFPFFKRFLSGVLAGRAVVVDVFIWCAWVAVAVKWIDDGGGGGWLKGSDARRRDNCGHKRQRLCDRSAADGPRRSARQGLFGNGGGGCSLPQATWHPHEPLVLSCGVDQTVRLWVAQGR